MRSLSFTADRRANLRIPIASVVAILLALCALGSSAAQRPPASSTDPVVITQQVHRDLPAYTFKLTPHRGAQPCSQVRCLVGTIDISVNAQSKPLQTIQVYSFADVSWFTRSFTVHDDNFDGFNDISILDDHGAKWGAFHHWLFEPESGRFVSNDLAKQLDQLSGNRQEYDATTKEIRISTLMGGCAESWETFQILDGKPVLVRAEQYIQPIERPNDPAGAERPCMTVRTCFTQTQLRRIPIEAHHGLMSWTYDNSVPLDLPWRLREISPAGFVYSADHTNTKWDQVLVRVYQTPSGWRAERLSGRAVAENACQD
jgi:hypothetical protein